MVTVSNVLVAMLAASLHLSFGQGDPLNVKVIQKFAGGDSHVHAPMARLIPNEKQWNELWSIHKVAVARRTSTGETTVTPAPPVPTVDFTKNQVLVVFGGKLPTVQAYDYVKTFAQDKVAVIQLSQIYSQNPPPQPFYPYILLVIPKEPVPIEVQLDSVAKDGSHYWMTIAKYPAPKPGG